MRCWLLGSIVCGLVFGCKHDSMQSGVNCGDFLQPASGGPGYSYYASVSGEPALKMFAQARALGLPEFSYF